MDTTATRCLTKSENFLECSCPRSLLLFLSYVYWLGLQVGICCWVAGLVGWLYFGWQWGSMVPEQWSWCRYLPSAEGLAAVRCDRCWRAHFHRIGSNKIIPSFHNNIFMIWVAISEVNKLVTIFGCTSIKELFCYVDCLILQIESRIGWEVDKEIRNSIHKDYGEPIYKKIRKTFKKLLFSYALQLAGDNHFYELRIMHMGKTINCIVEK